MPTWSTGSSRACRPKRRRWRWSSRSSSRSGSPRRASAAFAIRRQRRAATSRRPGDTRHRDLRRLPARAVRPGRPPLPLSVHQLHELRSPVHDRARRPLRPAADHDGGLHDVPDLPRRVRGPGRPALPRPAQRLPGVRAVAAAARSRPRAAPPAIRSLRSPPRLRAGRDRRRQGHRRLPPGLPGRRRGRGGGAAGPQAPRGQAVRADGAVARAPPRRSCRSTTPRGSC